MTDIENLKHMAWKYKCKRSPSVPHFAIPRPMYDDSSANGLTKCIHDFLKMKGHYCGRTNTTGTYSVSLGKYIHSGATRGQSDLNAIVNGRSWQIEIKHGKDQLSEVQKKIKAEVESAGGVYLEVRLFRDFIKAYSDLTGQPLSQVFTLTPDPSSRELTSEKPS